MNKSLLSLLVSTSPDQWSLVRLPDLVTAFDNFPYAIILYSLDVIDGLLSPLVRRIGPNLLPPFREWECGKTCVFVEARFYFR
jgi:hypothetical protein